MQSIHTLIQGHHATVSDSYVHAMERLISVIQELSHARDLETVAYIVRAAARDLTGADGATFVLRDKDECFYADENAIGPLWKGRRFPIEKCISGWVMMHGTPAVIPDIYADPRIPQDAYRPTFVRSLVMVPIRRHHPIGAIGNYWAETRHASDEEVAILQALADTTSVALANVDLYNLLLKKIGELENSNHDLSSFAWAASHDLQEPLRTIVTQMEMLRYKMGDKIGDAEQVYIDMALEGAGRLQHLVQNLLAHAHAGKKESFQHVSLQQVMDKAIQDLQVMIDECTATIHAEGLPDVHGDPHLLECLMQNLLSNALKFCKPGLHPQVRIEAHHADHEWIISVADNGVGIDPAYHEQIFGLFERLNPQDQYPGSGIGLATCRKIIHAHGGRMWVESTPGQGSCFWFTLPAASEET